MAFIVEDLIGDRAIQIGVEEIIRPFSFGTNWNKVRVGVRFSCYAISAISTGYGPYMGICTGNEALFSTNTTDAVFLYYGQSTASYSFLGTPPNVYLQNAAGSASIYSFQRVGNTTTQLSTSQTGSTVAVSAYPAVNVSAWFLDFFKVNTTQIQTRMFYCQSTQGAATISDSQFLAGMETETVAVGGMTITSGAANSTLALRQVYDWDSMFFHSSTATPAWNVHRMTVVRFY